MVIDHNDYELYGSENQSKCDSAPAVWLFPDIIRSVYFHETGRKSERHREEAWRMGWGRANPLFCFLPAASAGLYKLQLV